ncbi:hypothetical protein MTO96_036445 [Rhipicephalus appendiculatus]
MSTQRIKTRLEETITATPRVTPAAWDSLKAVWKTLLQQEGSARKRRITTKMNELLRRMRIVQSAEVLTTCTRDYLDSLQIQYDRLLRETTRETRAARATSVEPPEIDLREVSGNGSLRIAGRPDGTLTADPAEIQATFYEHFESAFREPDSDLPRPEPTLMEDLCKSLRRLDEDDCVTLCGAASIDELHGAIRSMPPNSAPGADGLTAGFYVTFFDVLGTRCCWQRAREDSASRTCPQQSKVLALKTARSLPQASDYTGKGLLLYCSGASNAWLEAGRHLGPLAEPPSPFYKAASATSRMLGKEAPSCDADTDPPARIVEDLTLNQLSDEDRQRARNAKRTVASLDRGSPREVHDFLWKMGWKVLPTRQRLNRLGIVPDARCPNSRNIESQNHALLECPAAKPVWRIVARCFGIRPPTRPQAEHRRFRQASDDMHALRNMVAPITRRGEEHTVSCPSYKFPSLPRGPVTSTSTLGTSRPPKADHVFPGALLPPRAAPGSRPRALQPGALPIPGGERTLDLTHQPGGPSGLACRHPPELGPSAC